MRLFCDISKNYEIDLTVQFRSPTLNIRNPSQDKKRLPTWLIAWSCDNNRQLFSRKQCLGGLIFHFGLKLTPKRGGGTKTQTHIPIKLKVKTQVFNFFVRLELGQRQVGVKLGQSQVRLGQSYSRGSNNRVYQINVFNGDRRLTWERVNI